MKIHIHLAGQSSGTLVVQRETGDLTCRGPGWSAEHQLLHRIKQRLNVSKFNLIKKRAQSDGHMWGDEATPYLRAANKVRRHPHIYIYDADYATRSSAEDFNKGKEVTFSIVGNIWDGVDQPNWPEICRILCSKYGPSLGPDTLLVESS